MIPFYEVSWNNLSLYSHENTNIKAVKLSRIIDDVSLLYNSNYNYIIIIII